MSDTEKNIYDSVLNNMDSSLANLFKISDPQRQAWNSQLDALKQSGIDNINSIYTPMQNNLKNDIAARFGNLDNSTFLNNLKKITDSKSQAVAQLSNNLSLAQNDLYTQELQNRMNKIIRSITIFSVIWDLLIKIHHQGILITRLLTAKTWKIITI